MRIRPSLTLLVGRRSGRKARATTCRMIKRLLHNLHSMVRMVRLLRAPGPDEAKQLRKRNLLRLRRGPTMRCAHSRISLRAKVALILRKGTPCYANNMIRNFCSSYIKKRETKKLAKIKWIWVTKMLKGSIWKN